MSRKLIEVIIALILVVIVIVSLYLFVQCCEEPGDVGAEGSTLPTGDTKPTPDIPMEPETLYGVDVSSYQEDNYEAALDIAQDFVICRAVAGYTVDENCDKIYQCAKERGKLLGVYFWCDPFSCAPRDHAAYCYLNVKGYIGESIFVLDFEPLNWDDGELDPGWALDWLNEFERLSGVKPLIYTNVNIAQTMDWTQVINEGYRLWAASYGNDDGKNYGLPDEVGMWAVMHQYTTCGLGARETLDINVFFGGEEEWTELTKVNRALH